ncbi:hypothetical protein HJG60_009386 [Phyllostomus discolor]|uniref:Uncharacterized protein n=1 Tax=Phyllostomus discolor TaxID=89673 RepID=A0A834DC09_9CHIR|nr:hypothetical protein HJG60_009386 [Phyllostomus discolor]
MSSWVPSAHATGPRILRGLPAWRLPGLRPVCFEAPPTWLHSSEAFLSFKAPFNATVSRCPARSPPGHRRPWGDSVCHYRLLATAPSFRTGWTPPLVAAMTRTATLEHLDCTETLTRVRLAEGERRVRGLTANRWRG